MIGWRHVAASRPNAAHHALAAIERSGKSEILLTQDVGGLHQAAGSRRVIDLHGRLDQVPSTACVYRTTDMGQRVALVDYAASLNSKALEDAGLCWSVPI